jgi:hypothetical protein
MLLFSTTNIKRENMYWDCSALNLIFLLSPYNSSYMFRQLPYAIIREHLSNFWVTVCWSDWVVGHLVCSRKMYVMACQKGICFSAFGWLFSTHIVVQSIQVAGRLRLGLRPLARWDCGSESQQEDGCLSVQVVCCQVQVSVQAHHLSRGLLQSAVCLWLWSLNSEETMVH